MRSDCSTRRATCRADPAPPARSAGLWGALLLAANAIILSTAHGQDVHGFELDWHAPAACPDRAAVITLLEPPHPASAGGHTALKAHARVTKTRAGYRLHLQLIASGASAHRELTSRDCEALAQATAVLIALAIEAESPAAAVAVAPESLEIDEERTESAEPEPGPQRPTEAQTASSTLNSSEGAKTSQTRAADASSRSGGEPRSSDLPAQRPDDGDDDGSQPRASPESSTLELAALLEAGATMDAGMLPRSPAWGIRLALGLRVGRLCTAFGFNLWPPAEAESDAHATARLVARAWTADLALGLPLAIGSVSLTPEVAFEYGLLHVDALGIADSQPARVTWMAAGAGVRAALAIAPKLELGLQARGLVPFERARYLLRTNAGDVPLFTSAPIALRVTLDLTYRIR